MQVEMKLPEDLAKKAQPRAALTSDAKDGWYWFSEAVGSFESTRDDSKWLGANCINVPRHGSEKERPVQFWSVALAGEFPVGDFSFKQDGKTFFRMDVAVQVKDGYLVDIKHSPEFAQEGVNNQAETAEERIERLERELEKSKQPA